MDFTFILYILLSIVIGIYGTLRVFQSERTLSAFLYLVGIILILVYFGIRWFQGSTFALGDNTPKQWPPVINSCPDFLTRFDVPGSTPRRTVCVDLIGVAGAGGIQKLTEPSQVFNENFVFRGQYRGSATTQAQLSALCRECRTKRVTWEGIFDGVSCSVPTLDQATEDLRKEAGCPVE
jgi:hypothetical protein